MLTRVKHRVEHNPSKNKLTREVLSTHRKAVLGIAAGFVILLGISYILSPQSFSVQDFSNLLRQSAGLGIVAIGQTLVIMTGGIDLSLGAIMTLTHLLTIGLMHGDGGRAVPVVLFALVVSTFIGFLNGLGITKGRIDPLIMTLCMSFILLGISLLYTGGSPRGELAPAFREIGRYRILGFVSWSTVIWLAVSILMIFVLRRTTFGAEVHMVGANRATAVFSGISKDRVLLMVYTLGGFFAGLAGVVLTSDMSAASIGLGDPYVMNSIAAVVLGGTLFVGGIGGVEGTVFGVLVLTVLNSLLQKAGIVNWGQYVFQAVAILGVAMLYSRKHRN